MNRVSVMVLMGGKSDEHEVSLVSGRSVVAGLDEAKYEVIPVIIPKSGDQWLIEERKKFIDDFSPKIGTVLGKGVVTAAQKSAVMFPVVGVKPDVVFIALHGRYGEDGKIQGMLDVLGLKYTGCGVLASAVGMDKKVFRQMMEANGIRIPKLTDKAPCVVKPADSGSSVGVSIVEDESQLETAVVLARKYSDNILIEEYVQGTEVSCGVLGSEALPVIEIVPKNKFFDYEAKYQDGMSQEICPARLSAKVTALVQETALAVFKAVGGRGSGRVDMIIRDEIPYVLEINTIPGLTPASLLPKEAAAAGISYSQLLDRMIELAMEESK